MGRTVIAEDGIESYVSSLTSKKELVVGLIFGQEITSQKSCVIHLARTPEPVAEENDENELESSSENSIKNSDKGKQKTEDFDDSLVLDHARQVTFNSYLPLFKILIILFYQIGNEISTWRDYNIRYFYGFKFRSFSKLYHE
jgi:hypothetical protein